MNFKTAILVFLCVTFIGATASKAQNTNTTDNSKSPNGEPQVVHTTEVKKVRTTTTTFSVHEIIDAIAKGVAGLPQKKSIEDSCHPFFNFENKQKCALQIEITELNKKGSPKIVGTLTVLSESKYQVYNKITKGLYEYKIFTASDRTLIATNQVLLDCNQEAKITIEAPTTPTTPTSNQ